MWTWLSTLCLQHEYLWVHMYSICKQSKWAGVVWAEAKQCPSSKGKRLCHCEMFCVELSLVDWVLSAESLTRLSKIQNHWISFGAVLSLWFRIRNVDTVVHIVYIVITYVCNWILWQWISAELPQPIEQHCAQSPRRTRCVSSYHTDWFRIRLDYTSHFSKGTSAAFSAVQRACSQLSTKCPWEC